MKAIILTEAGKNIGFGHLTRCIGLYQAFEEKNIDTEIIVNSDNSVDYLLKGIGHKKFNWLENRKELFSQLKGIDITIIDSYLADLDFYEGVSKIVKSPVYIDDYKRLDYPGGIVVNPSIYGDKIKYPQKDGVKYLLGKDYIILRKEFWNVPEKKISKSIKNILITFGGMNHQNLAERIKDYLISRFNFSIYIADPSKNLTAKKILNLMLKADLAISGGGQTTYELARVGVPTIGICFAKNQLFNLKYGQEAGYLKFVGWYNDKSLFNRIAQVIKGLNYNKRLKMSKRGKNYVGCAGVKKIIGKIKEK